MNSMKRQKKKKEKTKNIGHWKMRTPEKKISKLLLGKSGGHLLTAIERMKWLDQSRSDPQLWMYLVMKEKFNAVKKNIKKESGMLYP